MSALLAVVLLAVLLPLAGAAAGPAGSFDEDVLAKDVPARDMPAKDVPARGVPAKNGDVRAKADTPVEALGDGTDGTAGKPAKQARTSGLLSGLGLTTAAQCGPELASPEGVEAQTCVLSQGRDTWARTYYRNGTGEELSAVLTLMGPDGRTVQMHCAVDEGDEPGACETPRERTAGEPEAYSAVAEFAAPADADGSEGQDQGEGRPMLLRSGSNAAPATGS
ncbi:hypothetical protein G6045_28620 [Streptomyces sp. YC504]|uniref:DUF3558 domain-containing protein n=2 Tax=Streptomyces mesophilus TaxID=1775132 RepID=A0A6G4XPS3_9ACTN|nr:hypothetical protein [Streptomyces mesophilus]